eukprot:6965705-Alexandrium_andersonii.AAC.1
MTGKEFSEGGGAAFRLAQGDSAVVASAEHLKWFQSLKLGGDGLRYCDAPGARFSWGVTLSWPLRRCTRTRAPTSSRWPCPPRR